MCILFYIYYCFLSILFDCSSYAIKVEISSLIVLQFLASGTMLCLRRGACCGAKNMFSENCVFKGKLSFGKPRLTHICGTLSSRTPFSVCRGNVLFLNLLFGRSPEIMFVSFLRRWFLPPLDRFKLSCC